MLMSMKCELSSLLWIVACLGPCLAAAAACGPAAAAGPPARSFADDVAFLGTHTKILVLADERNQAQVAVAPAWQGRVMTSTAAGGAGSSYGWINRDFIAAGGVDPHINVFGGEDRFWLGPEGGQFSIFFAKGAPFDLEHWFTPAPIDTEPFEVVRSTRDTAQFRHAFALTNYSGAAFNVRVDRTVRLLAAAQAWKALGVPAAPGVAMVAFESINAITNAGRTPWTADTGLLSIWILGMFNPSPATTIVVPIAPGPESSLGTAVNADYFGAVPPDRLVVKDGVVFFSGDGQYRSKIGVGPRRVRPILGSYDAANPGADPGAVHPAARAARIREFDVGNSAAAVCRRRGEQLQRRTARAWRQAPRAVLRARIVVAGRSPGARRVARARAPDAAPDRRAGRARRDRQGHAGRRPG